MYEQPIIVVMDHRTQPPTYTLVVALESEASGGSEWHASLRDGVTNQDVSLGVWRCDRVEATKRANQIAAWGVQR